MDYKIEQFLSELFANCKTEEEIEQVYQQVKNQAMAIAQEKLINIVGVNNERI